MEETKKRKQETLNTAIRNRIKELASDRNMSLHSLSVTCQLAYSTLSSYMRQKCNSVTLTTIEKLCKGLDITVMKFFNTPEFKKIK